MLLFIGTTIVAIIIGLVLVNAIRPGRQVPPDMRDRLRASYQSDAELHAGQAEQTTERSPLQPLVDIVPENLFGSISDNRNMLQVVFIALLIGIGLIQVPKPSNKATDVNCPELIKHYMSFTAPKLARNAEWIGVTAGSQGSDKYRLQMLVEFIGRHYGTGACLANLATARGIQTYEVYFAALRACYRHSHSVSSNRVEVNSSRSPSSPRSWRRLAAAAQPARDFRAPLIIRPSSTTHSSTSLSRPACSINGLGIRMPRELPIRAKRVFILLPMILEFTL